MSDTAAVALPADFRYREVFLRGKPQHDRFDLFRIKHPCMDLGHRAKIFAPFAALKGFSESIAAKDVVYRDRIELSEDDRKELDKKLRILKGLTFNSRMARQNHVKVTVVYYVPCADENHDAFEFRGSYREISGICQGVDTVLETIRVDRTSINFDDILRLENMDGIFHKDWSSEYSDDGWE